MGAWVKYDGTFKDLWQLRNKDVSCFINAALKGKTTWQDSGKLLRLDDTTWLANGGYITFEIGTGWKVLLRIATENVDFFQDEIDDDYLIDEGTYEDGKFPDPPSDEEDIVVWEADKGFFGENDSEAMFFMNTEDILVIDVDAENVNDSKATRIRKDGKEYIKNYGKSFFGYGDVSTNEDTFIRLINAYYYVEDLEPTTTSDTGDEGDGDVDIDIEINDTVVIEDDDIENPVNNPNKDPDNPQDTFEPDLVIDPTEDAPENGGGGGGGNGGGSETEEDENTLRNIIFIAIMGILAFMVVRVVSMKGGDGDE